MGDLLLASPRVRGGQRLEANVNGCPVRLVECVERDGICWEWEPDAQVMFGVLQHEDDVARGEVIARFIVELTGRLSGRYGDDVARAVVVSPCGSGVFQCEPDTAAPVVRLYGKAFDRGYRSAEYFRSVRRVGKKVPVVGVVIGWSDEDRAYQALIVPCADELVVQSGARGDRIVGDWDVRPILDLFGEQALGGLVIVWGSYEADTDRGAAVSVTCDQGLESVPESHVLPPMGNTNDGGSTAVGRGVQARWRVLAPALNVLNLVHNRLRRGGDEL